MGSIIDRREKIEKEVKERGEQFLNDCTATIKLGTPNWKGSYLIKHPDFNTQYSKNWGHQGVLGIDAYQHLPNKERLVHNFSILISHGPWGAGVTNESYGLWSRNMELKLHNNYFFSVGRYTPDKFPYLEQRPLNEEEILDIHRIFSKELADFKKKSLVKRILLPKSVRWDREFMYTQLDVLRDKALEMNESDWNRYEHQKRRVAEIHRDVNIA